MVTRVSRAFGSLRGFSLSFDWLVLFTIFPDWPLLLLQIWFLRKTELRNIKETRSTLWNIDIWDGKNARELGENTGKMDVFNQIYLSLKNKMFVSEVQYLQKNRNLAVTGFLSMVSTY